MKILHISGDWKWTGPAGPMLELLLAQRQRGNCVDLACPAPPPDATTSLAQHAQAAGVSPILTLSRGQGVSLLRDSADVHALSRCIEQHDIDIVHSWHTRDHVLALRALGRRRQHGRTRLVRSYRHAEPIVLWPWNRWLFGSATDGLLCVSPDTADSNRRIRAGGALAGAFGVVDSDRFAPRVPSADALAALGLVSDDRIIAIVARVQRHRRFDLLLSAFQELVAREPRAKLLILGRGTHLDEVARAPAKRLGIDDRVCFAGYREADYVDALCAADVFTYLVPGSDGTCRALLEAASCSLPAVVTRRGSLSEIVVDGQTGLVVDEDPQSFADAWQRLLNESELAMKMGAAARVRAKCEFAPDRFAEQVDSLYAESISRSISR